MVMTIEIRVLQRGDDNVLMNVAAEVFDNPVRPEWIKEFLDDPRHHIAVAIDEGVVIGFASGVHYIHPDKPPELWISEVSIAPTHRGQGLGQAVLRALLELGRSLNCSEAWVLTYRDNRAANSLYASLGGTAGADTSGPSDAMVGYTFGLSGPLK
jgi:ribosomal protein S18 acetylase RimI-like enzyme